MPMPEISERPPAIWKATGEKQPGLGRDRKPWLAALLSLYAPGVGQLYAGSFVRALLVYLAVELNLMAAALVVVIVPFPLLAMSILLLSRYGVLFLAAGHAALLARRAERPYVKRVYNSFFVYAPLVILAGLITPGLWVFKSLADVHRVPTPSMAPTILIYDRVITDRLVCRLRDPERGEIVVFRYPRDEEVLYIKRVIGLPGEAIKISGREVSVNGRRLNEDYARFYRAQGFPGSQPYDADMEAQLGQDQYFLMGDNRDDSADSRYFGSVARQKILARVRGVFWSTDGAWRVRWDRLGIVFERPRPVSPADADN